MTEICHVDRKWTLLNECFAAEERVCRFVAHKFNWRGFFRERPFLMSAHGEKSGSSTDGNLLKVPNHYLADDGGSKEPPGRYVRISLKARGRTRLHRGEDRIVGWQLRRCIGAVNIIVGLQLRVLRAPFFLFQQAIDSPLDLLVFIIKLAHLLFGRWN